MPPRIWAFFAFVIAIIGHLSYIGFDLIFFNDSSSYLWLTSIISLDLFFSSAYSGFHPPLYSFFVKGYSSLLGMEILEATKIVNILMNGVLSSCLYFYALALGLTRLNSFLVCLMVMSNCFLYSHATAGLYAEVLYFPIIILMLCIAIHKKFQLTPIYYLALGSLVLIRNFNIFLLLLVLWQGHGFKKKVMNGALFILPALLLQLKQMYFDRSVRDFKESLKFQIDWSADYYAIKNVFGLSFLPDLLAAALLVAIGVATVYLLVRNMKRDSSSQLGGIVLVSFISIIVLTHFFFDSKVSFRERLNFHAYLIVLPVVLAQLWLVLSRNRYRQMIFSLVIAIFVILNAFNYHSQKLLIDSILLGNIRAQIPSMIKEYPSKTFVVSNMQSLLKVDYDLDGYDNFFKEEKISVNYAANKKLTPLPARFESLILYIEKNKPLIEVSSLLAQLDECDLRAQYDYRIIFQDIDFERGLFEKVRTLPRKCYE